MGDVVKLTRPTDDLPHARWRRNGAEVSAELTYDHGKTWVPCPKGEIALNPLPIKSETAMTPEQREAITRLAEKAHDARRAYEGSRAWNTAGLTPEEARKQTVACELLLTEMQMANAALSRAQIAAADSV